MTAGAGQVQEQMLAPVAARIRAAVTRAGVGFLLSGICAYGLVRVADEEPIAGFLTLPLTSCPLTGLAVVVARSVLRPIPDRG